MKQYQESVFGEWQNQEVRAYRLENDKGLPIICHDLWGDDLRICDA